jgi:hypothetical protein
MTSSSTVLMRSSNSPRYIGARDHARQVERKDAFSAEILRDAPFDDLLRESLRDGRFAHARLADEHGVVLGAAGQDLDDALDFLFTTDDGIQPSLAGKIGQIAPV